MTSFLFHQNAFFSFSVHPICGAYTLMTLTILSFRTNLTDNSIITFTTFVFVVSSNIIQNTLHSLILPEYKMLYPTPISFALYLIYLVSCSNAIFKFLFLIFSAIFLLLPINDPMFHVAIRNFPNVFP